MIIRANYHLARIGLQPVLTSVFPLVCYKYLHHDLSSRVPLDDQCSPQVRSPQFLFCLHHVTRFLRRLHKVKRASCFVIYKMLKERIVAQFFQGFWVAFLYTFFVVGYTGISTFGLLYFLYRNPHLWPLVSLYLIWMFIDWRTPKRGGRKFGVNFVGSMLPFRCLRDYYPISLVKTADLDPERNYVFGYHPHGLVSDGLAISFGTNLLGFKQTFPGITPHIGGHFGGYLMQLLVKQVR